MESRQAPSKVEPFLRRLHEEDAESVLAAFEGDAQMARQGIVTSLAEAHAYIDRLTHAGSAHRPWAIVSRGRLIGLVCVTVDEENLNGWFFYWMSTGGRGRGWMKRAAATVADWALGEGAMYRLELGHRVNNPGSGAVARAAGFVKEGTEREKFLIDGARIDVDTYSRLRTDPLPKYEPLAMRDAG